MTRYCPPIRDRWQPENGVRLSFDPGAQGGALFAASCRHHGIPCASVFATERAAAVPMAVADLVQRAVDLAAEPVRAAPLWAEAERLLAAAEARMLAAEIASAEQRFTQAA